MRKIIYTGYLKKLVILIACIALILSGCGANGSQMESTDDAEETETENDAAVAESEEPSSEPEETTGLYASDLIDLDDLIGWASVSGEDVETTTGGGDITPILVTTYEELAELAADDEPRVILVQGTITCNESIKVNSNKTIVGLDEEAIIQGGFEITDVSNVIISNLEVDALPKYGAVKDGISVYNSHHVWLDHLYIHDASDGLLDITMGSDYATVSWCKFAYTNTRDHRFACLVGSGTGHDDTDMGKLNVTYHHNWFADKILQRQPRILYGKAHVYNNYYTSASSARGYCIGVACYASVMIENNYFQNVTNPHQFMYADAIPSYIYAVGNIYDNTSGDQDTGISTPNKGSVEPFTEPPYEYTADDTEDVPELVSEGAGPHNLQE